MLPQLAQGDANKIFVIPSEFSQALSNVASRFAPDGNAPKPSRPKGMDEIDARARADAEDAARAAAAAERQAEVATQPSHGQIAPPPPTP